MGSRPHDLAGYSTGLLMMSAIPPYERSAREVVLRHNSSPF